MSGERERLAEALFAADYGPNGDWELGKIATGVAYYRQADALMPTVAAMLREAQAEALDEMAQVFDADARNLEGGEPYARAAADLRDRAAALREQP